MTKEDYMHLPKERLAELLAERDTHHRIDYIPTDRFTLPCYAPGGICTNPFKDCINCPKQFGDGTTTITTTTLEEWMKGGEE